METRPFTVHFYPRVIDYSERIRRELSALDIALFLLRHLGGDWGDVCEDQAHENDTNVRLRSGSLRSIFRTYSGKRVWVVTEGSWQRCSMRFEEEMEGWKGFPEEPRSTVH